MIFFLLFYSTNLSAENITLNTAPNISSTTTELIEKINSTPTTIDWKVVEVTLIVSGSSPTCGTLNVSGTSGPISNCSPWPNERTLAFLVDPQFGFDMNFDLHIGYGNWNVNVEGYQSAQTVCTQCTGVMYWMGNVPINPNSDVTRVAVVATQS